MTLVVVDASVAAKWLLSEEDSDRAETLLTEEWQLIAPDLIYAEVAAIAWKRSRRGEMDPDKLDLFVSRLLMAPLETTPASKLVAAALELAVRHDRSVYDSLYLALAIQRGCQFVTADTRFRNALSRTEHAERVVHLKDLPA